MLSVLGQLLLVLAMASLVYDLWRRDTSALASVCLLTALLLLAIGLLANRFELAYVQTYSARALPAWLKVAGLWGGEQGTLLLLATMLAGLAWQQRAQPAVSRGLVWLALGVTVGALRFNAFAPAEQIRPDGLGLNAHLISPWMALHPPAVLLAYALLWVPIGASLHSLGGAPALQWKAAVLGPARVGWVMLSLGLASGMWWAFEDYTYGQFWHWDPVQTAVFVVWALATAQLHGARQLVPSNSVPTLLLICNLACVVSIPLALLIVRDATLASSHRYLGDTSRWLMLTLAMWPLLCAIVILWRRRTQQTDRCDPSLKTLPASRSMGNTSTVPVSYKRPLKRRLPGLLSLASVTLMLAAVAATLALLYSYLCAGLDCARDFVPFRQAVLQWAGGEELIRLTHAFAHWEIDHFVATRLLLPLVGVMLLLTGYSFARSLIRRAWQYTALFALVSVGLAFWISPLEQLIDGTGVTTAHTTALFKLLDILLFWCLWPLSSTALWCVRAWRVQGMRAFSRAIPVGMMHLGAVLVVVGATVSTTLDSSSQRTLELPGQYGEPVALGPDLTVTVSAPKRISIEVGAVGGTTLQALSEIHYATRHNATVQRHASVLYRDPRALNEDVETSSFRQRCMILDHRFARALDRPGYMLQPVIDRGLLVDQQLWMPADPPAQDTETRESVLILRRFPLLSLLWIGLSQILLAGVLLLVSAHYRPA